MDTKPIHPPHPSGHRYVPVARPDNCGRIALVLQGGGALGAYQGGVYQALHEAGLEPDWIAGISIGAVNAAIIAGNPRETRIDRLRQFWQRVSRPPGWGQAAGLAQQASLRPYL